MKSYYNNIEPVISIIFLAKVILFIIAVQPQLVNIISHFLSGSCDSSLFGSS
jgi:hypothetical protein